MPKLESSDGPVEITLSFLNINVVKVDDREFSITLRMYLRIHWTEPRLIVSNVIEKKSKTPLDTSLLDYLWLTNFFIYNLKQTGKDTQILNVGGPSEGEYMIYGPFQNLDMLYTIFNIA